MAIEKCRECGTDVSDQAKICPKCGINKPVKKTSLSTKIIAGVFCIFIARMIINHSDGNPPPQDTSTTQQNMPEVETKEQAINSVKLEKFNWTKGGFDNVMILNATIKNEGSRDIKDFEIECSHTSNSGTKIDSNKKVIFELVKAGKSFHIKDFSMGFIHSQAASTSCSITDLVLL